ncbi:hypothetical protein B0T10DRAFT_532110 [Thelonectria olida]|uniref:VWFA domain-containing protein n=1 Tax=Thelonectria olida TaxID=1576542 RepID=A0A9P8VY92_9HYPO|nr:hypothetical protein B0T10DRAFT_532110 [Thelonectria olida]
MSFFTNLKNNMSRSSKNDAPQENNRTSDSNSKNACSMKCDSLTPNPAVLDAPPPAYSRLAPKDGSSRRSVSLSRASITSAEDRYAFLSTFDTIFVIDDSGSMAGRSWREVRDALAAITPICASHDPDGIDLYFLNHRSGERASEGKAAGGYTNIRDANQVQNLFKTVFPTAATPTGTRLESILRPYMRNLEKNKDNVEDVKPINIIVITDGCATDDPESIILRHARKLEKLDAPPHQVGIQFFQVGNEPSAAEALRNLDDNLGASRRSNRSGRDEYIRDMVDTVAWSSVELGRNETLSADGILKVVLGAVIRKLDDKILKP